jgi:hypothetical protein
LEIGDHDENDHSRTKARHPQTNGICERFHRTIQEEFYATAFRKKLYTSLQELQADLDEWLDEYNRTRPHSGKYCCELAIEETNRSGGRDPVGSKMRLTTILSSPLPIRESSASTMADIHG